MANIKIPDLIVNTEIYTEIYDEFARNAYNKPLDIEYPTLLKIQLDTINYNYNEIVQDIANDVEIYGYNLSSQIMDAAYKLHRLTNGVDQYASIRAIAAVLHKAVGYHYVMSILMKYMKDKDLDGSEWKAISDFLYKDEKKPYEWDDNDHVYKVKKK